MFFIYIQIIWTSSLKYNSSDYYQFVFSDKNCVIILELCHNEKIVATILGKVHAIYIAT